MQPPATVCGKGVRGNGRQEVMVGRGTCSPPNVVGNSNAPTPGCGHMGKGRASAEQPDSGSTLLTAGPV